MKVAGGSQCAWVRLQPLGQCPAAPSPHEALTLAGTEAPAGRLTAGGGLIDTRLQKINDLTLIKSSPRGLFQILIGGYSAKSTQYYSTYTFL